MRAAAAPATGDGAAAVRGRAAVEAAVEAHEAAGAWRLPAFATNGDARLFKKIRNVRSLLRALSGRERRAIVGADAADAGLSPAEAEEQVVMLLEHKAGPTGEQAAKAARSLRLLHARQRRLGAEESGRASRAMVAAVVRAEQRRAQLDASGSQGGRTVGGTIREGFLFLQSVVGLPIEADSLLVEAAAVPMDLGDVPGGRAVNHARSLPLGVQCQFEHVAASSRPSVLRTIARAFLVTSLAHGLRMNDALNAVVWLSDGVLEGRTAVRSKDGLPLGLHAPAEGFLGPWEWAAEHFDEMAARPHAIPDFDARCPSMATSLRGGVLPQRKALDAFYDVCAAEPLCMSRAEFAGITTHSPHGTPADLVRFMGAERGFSKEDTRAAGHWLRDRHAALELPARPHGAVPAGAPNARADMDRRYTQGPGRAGERQEQLSLRTRIVSVVRQAIAASAVPWHALPRSLESWDVLL